MSYPYHRGNNSNNSHNSSSNGSSSMYNRGSNNGSTNNNRIADEANVTLMELENNQRWVSC